MAPLSDTNTLLHACTYAVNLITCHIFSWIYIGRWRRLPKNYIRVLRNLKGVNNATQEDFRNIFEN